LADCCAAKVERVSIGERGSVAAGMAPGVSGLRSAQAEVDLRHVRGLRLGLEELTLREAKRAGDQHVREDLERVVVVERNL